MIQAYPSTPRPPKKLTHIQEAELQKHKSNKYIDKIFPVYKIMYNDRNDITSSMRRPLAQYTQLRWIIHRVHECINFKETTKNKHIAQPLPILTLSKYSTYLYNQ